MFLLVQCIISQHLESFIISQHLEWCITPNQYNAATIIALGKSCPVPFQPLH